MADDERDPSAAAAKRRRPAPTIDLKATEIASDPVNKTEPADPAGETPPATDKPSGEPEAKADAPEPAAAQASARPGWGDREAMSSRFSAWRERAGRRSSVRVLAAALAGAFTMLVVVAALWLSGAVGARDDLAGRLSTVETQVRELTGRPQPVGLDQRAFADLAARIGAAEQAMARLNDYDARIAKAEAAASAPRAGQSDQSLTARIAVLEAALRPLADLPQRADAAKARADAAFEAAQKSAAPGGAAPVAHGELDALAARVAALEQAAKALDGRIATTAGADRALRLAFVASSLRGAVERGEPFVNELAAAKVLAPDAAMLAPLDPFAPAGLPRAAVLAREFSPLATAMLAAAGTPGSTGIMDRLQQNAERLVRIRPVNETPAGDDVAATVTRADTKATQGDIAGALAELSRLPPAVREPAQGWIKKAEARNAALDAARRLTDHAAGALKAAP